MSSSISVTPKVGDLATLCYPQDRYPYMVTAVSPGGNKVTLAELERAANAPARFAGPFPIWDCDGDPATRTGRTVVAHRQGNGNYAVGGSTPIVFGRARFYRDYSD